MNLWLILIALIAVMWAFTYNSKPAPSDLVSFSQFLDRIEQKEVSDLKIDGRKITIIDQVGKEASTWAPSDIDTQTVKEWRMADINVEITPPPKSSPISPLMTVLLGLGLLAVVFFYFSRSKGNPNDGAFNFTKSKARVLAEAPKTSFKEVAGCEEAKDELKEIVEFLKSPTRFHDMGARIPKGVLLVGPPGSGKTHIARAVAGEAKVPFIAASGSDFVEMFVGVGAARVRDLFETAKRHTPCIIFIDEIDAVGRRRGGGFGGGNDEREQTLNQLLVEMDGFEKDTSVIIMAATNRPDVLDPALMRPGRFDRQVSIDAPDVRGREQILRIHAKGKPIAEEVDLATVARRTSGFVGADLENLLNEAALLAARDNRKKITMKDLEEAADRVVMGPAKKSMVISARDREITAFHEGGHALAAHFLEHADPVHKITIVPRGRALGFMMPDHQDAVHWTKKKLTDQIAVSLAGRVAEELVFDDVTTGAESDFRKATDLARRMITEWGMHPDFGFVAYQIREETYLGGHDTRQYSDETANRIDAAVQALLQEQHDVVQTLLTEKREVLERVTAALLERETLNAEEFITVVEGGELVPLDADLANPLPPTTPPDKSDNDYPKPVAKIKPRLGGA